MTDGFAERLIAWQRLYGRHDLPWQRDRDPYRIWVSEIMLQQTRVETAIPFFERFMARFPDLPRLAAATQDQVLGLWSGLGYYARARNLHACALRLVEYHDGRFPEDPQAIAALPGIGRSTAAAIAAFAFGARVPILDGNVKRVLCRHFAVEGFPGSAAVEGRLWQLAESLLPQPEVGRYIQAQMDLGATVCLRRNPHCPACPLQATCLALRDGRIGELPAPRPRRARPRRCSAVIVVRHQDRVLLHQRPPHGVWGGLLSLPETGALAPEQWLRRDLGVAEARIRPLAALTHEFTHFTLELRPQLADIGAMPTTAAAPGWRWLPLAGLDEAPLPAPVRRILAGLQVCC